MAAVNFAPSPTAPRSRAKVRELLPSYRTASGPTSFRHGLPHHERSVIDAALGILGRYLCEPGAVYDSPSAVREFLRLHLGAERTELFAVLYLDSQIRAIAFEAPFAGTLNNAVVYPREIARAALTHNAAAVILAHNHPSGSLEFSPADLALTKKIKAALDALDVRVLDHFIVGGHSVASMVELGMM